MRDGQTSTVVHIENSYASGQKKRPRGPRSTVIADLPSTVDAFPPTPLLDLKSQAIMYYMHYQGRSLEDAQHYFKGVPDDSLPTRLTKMESPMLKLAFGSMALALFSQMKHHLQAGIQASTSYQRLLKVAQATIFSLDERNIDACLLAISFMTQYENVVHRHSHTDAGAPIVTTLPSFSHSDGAFAILKFWKENLSQKQHATNVIKLTRRSMIKSALLRSLPLPEWILNGGGFGEQGLQLEYDRLIIRIVNIRHRLQTITMQETGKHLIATVKELDEEAQNVDMALQNWKAHFPNSWSYQRHALPNPQSYPTKDFYNSQVYSYASPAHSAAPNQYHATRMLINSTRLRILDLIETELDDSTSQQRLHCLSNITKMGDDLASSVAFCLQRFKVVDSPTSSPNSTSFQESITLTTKNEVMPYVACLVIWPLTIGSSLAYVDVKQRSWFKSELVRVGRKVGHTMFECADTDHWLEL